MATAEELGIEDVYEVVTGTFGIYGETHKGRFQMTCPDPAHNDTNPSASVNLADGMWNCFSCPAKGDIIDLGALVLNERKGTILHLFRTNDPTIKRGALQKRLEGHRSALRGHRAPVGHSGVSVPGIGSYERCPTKLLSDRGFSRETLRKWNVRYAELVTLFKDEKPFELRHAICIPILSESGAIVAWCYRATKLSPRWFQEIRYIYTPGVTDTLNKTWFGANFHKAVDNIVVVEGAFDAMWCDQNGIPALAILGSQVKQLAKIRKLMRYRQVTILTDRDSAGVSTAFTLGSALQERGVPTMVGRYSRWMLNRKGEPAGDAQDLSGLDLELVVARAVPFVLWKQAGSRAA